MDREGGENRLQLILAAPDTAQGTLSGVLDSYIELFRDGDLLQAERIEVGSAARELLLAQSSDWAFIMKTRTMVDYAVRRTKQHIHDFTSLYEMVKRGQIDERFLADLEYRNNIFPFIDFRVYAG